MKTRMPLDFYPTSQKLTEQLLLKYPISKDKVILEPCNGNGHISNFLKQDYSVITNDINPSTNSTYLYDFTDKNVINIFKGHCNVILTNPPFNVANRILENSLEIADEVIMLLRLSFLEGTKNRINLLNNYKDNLVKVITINPRPQFREDTTNTDSVCPMWLIYNKKHSWSKIGIDPPIDFIDSWNK